VTNPNQILNQLIGLGKDSAHKSYYPQLMQKISEINSEKEQLQRVKSYLDNVLNSIDDLIVGVNEDLRITFANERAQRTSLHNSEQLVGATLETQFPFLNPFQARICQVIQKTETITRERIGHGVQRNGRILELTVSPLRSLTLRGAVITIVDVTDTVRIHEMLVHSEKINSMGNMAAGMAHEINNPLAAISQNAQVLQTRISKDNKNNRRVAEQHGIALASVVNYIEARRIPELLSGIVDASLRASRIINNMLAFARKSSGEKSTCQIPELLDETLIIVKADYNLKRNYEFGRVVLEYNYQPVPEIQCARTEMQQVFLNFLQNAVHAVWMRRQKEPDITPKITIATAREDNFVVVKIIDNGTGMDASTKKNIFRPFYTTKPVGTGTGLGLSISHFIVVEEHNGKIEVDSTLGTGTEFRIFLPWEPQVSGVEGRCS
jgi:PAS domain S-box-containing protein